MYRWLFALITGSLFLIALPLAAQPDTTCPPLPARLTVGEYARVTTGDIVNFREEPTVNAARLDSIPAGTLLEVVGEATCADGYRWWQVIYDGTAGWVAEGADEDDYWLEPRGRLTTRTDDDGVTRRYVIDEDGNILEREGCLRPPDDYDRVRWGGVLFNQRTVAMLEHADRLYREQSGTARLIEQMVQGSYNPGVVEASFGTHDGGGAVDISVRSRVDFSVLTQDIPLMLDALRTAGFAAWLRAPDELYPGSAIHIHAIAIGDAELSEAARGQIDGEFGYLRGYNGLPQADGNPPVADIYGAPVICRWMIEMGFEDLR